MRVLAVDDEPDLLMLYRLAFERAGHTFLEAADGLCALDVLENDDEVDVVLLDSMMPHLDGMAVLERLEPIQHPAVVMVSARSAAEDQMKALSAGAVDYIIKPFSTMGLPAYVNDLMELSTEERSERRENRMRELALTG